MISETFLGPLYALKIKDLGPQHALRVSCFCGAGPWYLNTFWLRQRHGPHEFLRWIVRDLPCPNCTTRDVMAWVVVEASAEG